MKRNAFTLAELLGVVIILGCLMLFVVTPIVNNINSNKFGISQTNIKLIISTTEDYIENNKLGYKPSDGKVYYITMEQLIDSKLLDKKILLNDANNIGNYNIKLEGNGNSFDISLIEKDKPLLYDIVKNESTITFNNSNLFTSNENKYYVYYSGILWRIIGINDDKSIKLISNEPITALIPSDGSSNYEESYIRKWLNEEFYSKLLRNDLIVSSNFCADIATSSSSLLSNCTLNLKDKVGLLSLYDLNNGLNKNIVDTSNSFALSTINSSNDFYVLNSNKEIESREGIVPIFVKPVININNSVIGIKETSLNATTYLVNEEMISLGSTTKNKNLEPGRYLKFNNDNNIFRIMESTDDYIKLISQSILYTGNYSSSNDSFNLNSGIGFELNNQILNSLNFDTDSKNKIIKNMIFTAESSNNYNLYHNDKYLVEGAYLGIPKLGDMFLNPNFEFATMTENSSNYFYYITSSDITTKQRNSNIQSKIILYIENDFIIESGNGMTINTPYILEAP